ncbi:Beauvericin cluster-specific repressor BEA4 [Colletotrichum siamense]|uniref:Beauvericin cluster-specific repressor BEA4 n=1 Tax=Colletotrichum siamense TaxID=690259 RepID=UPI00187261C8|nr:Beauvericin cluster-specific repressor BEA4 [Colletotrichum siamense]KAF5511297.1 Beauvericin cluster-specific repressor BEA4 [Colletotrichum siamense]
MLGFQRPASEVDLSIDTNFLGSALDADNDHSSSPSNNQETPRIGLFAEGSFPSETRSSGFHIQQRHSLFENRNTEILDMTMSTALIQQNRQLSSPIPKEPFNIPTSLSEYFFREVITLYCAWDSKSNVMRNIIETSWQSSGALYHTIQSMSAACLSEDFPHLLPIARREHAQALKLLRQDSLPTHKQAMLLASQLLGHTSSWLTPQNLATDMFRTSCDILQDVMLDTGRDATISFFSDTMDYWAMLLAYLTDSHQLGNCDRNSPFGPAESAKSKSEEPHPYSGISRDTVKILADIGVLVFQYRKRISKVKFLTENDIDVFRTALREARKLERVLLAHRSPDLSQVKDPGDPKTPLRHLQLIDEAYRCTGLLQLYRVFPDLLNERYAPWDKDYLLRPLPSDKTPTAQERQTWLTKLAMHILGILREIPFESRTRSAQPFIMVACSSELRRNPQHLQSASVAAGDLDVLAIDPASIEVARARKFVLSRLAAYTHILPLRKSRVISELIDQIWSALDSGSTDVYWLDVAHEKNLGTMMG